MTFSLVSENIVTTAGSVFVVPKGRWHRVRSEEEVTVYGITLGATQHSEAEDPR